MFDVPALIKGGIRFSDPESDVEVLGEENDEKLDGQEYGSTGRMILLDSVKLIAFFCRCDEQSSHGR